MNTSRRKARPAPAQTEAGRKEAEASEGDLMKLRAMWARLVAMLAVGQKL